MSRAHMLTLRRPHEAFCLPMPVGKRISQRSHALGFVVCLVATVVLAGTYIYHVNSAATKTFTLRSLEQRLEKLQGTVSDLENGLAKEQSLHNVGRRVEGRGYVRAERIEYIEASASGYALAR